MFPFRSPRTMVERKAKKKTVTACPITARGKPIWLHHGKVNWVRRIGAFSWGKTKKLPWVEAIAAELASLPSGQSGDPQPVGLTGESKARRCSPLFCRKELRIDFPPVVTHDFPHMKIRKTCAIERQENEFYLIGRKRYPDPTCKHCRHAQNRDRRRGKPKSQKDVQANLARREDRLAFIRSLKDNPCMDCGQKFHPCAMDFDHRDAAGKVFSIAMLGRYVSMKRLMEEIAKCDLVCSNCHRLRTYTRRRSE